MIASLRITMGSRLARMCAPILLVPIIALCGNGCAYITEHTFICWNHSEYDARVVYSLPPHYFQYAGIFERVSPRPQREYVDTIRAGEKRPFLQFKVEGGAMWDGDSMSVKIFHGDSLVYQQATLSSYLWDTVYRQLGIFRGYLHTATYTLHVFNASTRQPTWEFPVRGIDP